MAIILFILVLMVLLDIAALRWGQDSTDGRMAYAWEMRQHGQNCFSALHQAFTAI